MIRHSCMLLAAISCILRQNDESNSDLMVPLSEICTSVCVCICTVCTLRPKRIPHGFFEKCSPTCTILFTKYLAVEVDASVIWIECDRVTLSTVTVLTKEWSSLSTMLTGTNAIPKHFHEDPHHTPADGQCVLSGCREKFQSSFFNGQNESNPQGSRRILSCDVPRKPLMQAFSSSAVHRTKEFSHAHHTHQTI